MNPSNISSDGPNGPLPGARLVSLGALHPIRSHATFIAVFTLSAALSALLYTYVFSERFSAETTTLFEPAEVTRLSMADTRALGSPVPNTPFKVIGQTFDGLIKSDAVLRDTVETLHLDAPDIVVYNGPWYLDLYKWTKKTVQDYGSDAWSYLQFGRVIPKNPVGAAIKDLRKHTKVVSEDSYVFELRTLGKTPDAAAKTADFLAGRLIATINGEEKRAALKRADELKRLSDAKFAEVTALEAKQREMLETTGSASIDAEINETTSRRSQLQLQLADAQASLHEENSRVVNYVDRLRGGEEVNRAAAYNDRLRGRISTPLMADASEALGSSGGRLRADDFSHLNSERLAAENKAKGLGSRIDALEREMDPITARLQLLNTTRSKYELVGTQLQTAKRDLVALSDALQESIIKASNVQPQLRIQSPAYAPGSPASPIKIYHVGLAAALALALGLGMAVLLSYFDIRWLMFDEKWRMPLAARTPNGPPKDWIGDD